MLAALSNLAPQIRPWLGIALILGGARLLLAAVGALARRQIAPEVARKTFHVGMGTLLLTGPWLFDRPWPMLLLAATFIGLLLARLYFAPLQYYVAGVIYGVARKSMGEYCFPLIAALLFALARADVLLYVVPLSLLVYADAAAALVGTRYGMLRFQLGPSRKTLEGSVAFLVTAFFTTHVPILLAGRTSSVASLWIALVVALCCAAIEAVCWNGLDNVLVPLVAFSLLKGLHA